VRQLSILLPPAVFLSVIPDIPISLNEDGFLLSSRLVANVYYYVNAIHMDTHVQGTVLSWIDTK